MKAWLSDDDEQDHAIPWDSNDIETTEWDENPGMVGLKPGMAVRKKTVGWKMLWLNDGMMSEGGRVPWGKGACPAKTGKRNVFIFFYKSYNFESLMNLVLFLNASALLFILLLDLELYWWLSGRDRGLNPEHTGFSKILICYL